MLMGCSPWLPTAEPASAGRPPASPLGSSGPSARDATPGDPHHPGAGVAAAPGATRVAAQPAFGGPSPAPGSGEPTSAQAAGHPGPRPEGAKTAGGGLDDSGAEGGAAGQDDEIDDDIEGPSREPSQAAPSVPPTVAGLSDEEILRRLQRDPASLGPMSVGRANSGALVNGVQLGNGTRYVVQDPANAWGTRETVDDLDRAYDLVKQELPDTPKLYVGHLSAKHGGSLSPHKSHQAGRDVDVSYFYVQGKHEWYRRATIDNLDLPHTWAFVRALLTETDVEYIFMNGSVQKLVKDYALAIGEDPGWLDQVFQYGSRQPDAIIRHAHGHDTHIHVRFYNPVAQELGRHAYGWLFKAGKIKPRVSYLQHRAVSGDTLGYLARHYGTTVQAIQQANGLRGIALQAKHVYLIPKAGKEGKAPAVEPPPGPTHVPPRRLPPFPMPVAGATTSAPRPPSRG